MKCRLALRACLLLSAPSLLAQTEFAQSTMRASVSSGGAQGDYWSFAPVLSSDGRYVVFEGEATNLVSSDTNGRSDIFVRDRLSSTTTRVSLNSSGAQADDSSYGATVTPDGRYVAFRSFATNLVAGDTNGVLDVFVRDRATNQTTRISVDSAGGQANSASFAPALSADGRYVAFWSHATNLVAGDANGWSDVFVHDRQTGATTRVSVDSFGAEANYTCGYPSISADGRYVAFESNAGNLAPGDDLLTPFTDVFVHDRQTGQTTRVSCDSNGVKGDAGSYKPSISADGRCVAFHSDAWNRVPFDTIGTDVFVHDRQTGQTTRVSVTSSGAQADFISEAARISADARHVAFTSLATNLVAGDTNNLVDVFVHDRQTGQTTRASVTSSGAQANNGSVAPSISSDGRVVAFESNASNLVPFDTNSNPDVFVREAAASPSWADLGNGLAGAAGIPSLGASGACLASHSTWFQIAAAASSAPGALVLGTASVALPIYGGVLVPNLVVLMPFATSAAGTASKSAAWPSGLPSGLSVYAQGGILDAAGVQGLAATRAIIATAP
jgi:Tol biopolymer transport system component